MRIIFGAVVSTSPFSAGMAWNWMHHVVGLQRLGHEVFLVEEVRPEWCVDEHGRPTGYGDSVNRRRFRFIAERFGLRGRACQLLAGTDTTEGLSLRELGDVAVASDLLVNISGHVTSSVVMENVRRCVYVDQDPVYTQLWHSEYGQALDTERYDAFFTVGLELGTPNCPIPNCGVEWYHYLPPVILDFWPIEAVAPHGKFSAIASWSGYGDVEYRGEWYRSKHVEFERFASLPRRSGQEMEVILKAFRDDDPGIGTIRDGGWHVVEAGASLDLDGYQGYISSCRAEIGIAKNAYVKGRSGWFSDRSAHFLASGRPVLAQSTGFEHHVPTGEGLLAFADLDEAIEGVAAINRDYELHCRAARAIAEEHLDYRRVLEGFLEQCTASV